MKAIDLLSVIMVVVGALNWGLIGLFQFNIVSSLLGEAAVLSRLVYILVGAAGLYQLVQWKAIHCRWTSATPTAIA